MSDLLQDINEGLIWETRFHKGINRSDWVAPVIHETFMEAADANEFVNQLDEKLTARYGFSVMYDDVAEVLRKAYNKNKGAYSN